MCHRTIACYYSTLPTLETTSLCRCKTSQNITLLYQRRSSPHVTVAWLNHSAFCFANTSHRQYITQRHYALAGMCHTIPMRCGFCRYTIARHFSSPLPRRSASERNPAFASAKRNPAGLHDAVAELRVRAHGYDSPELCRISPIRIEDAQNLATTFTNPSLRRRSLTQHDSARTKPRHCLHLCRIASLY